MSMNVGQTEDTTVADLMSKRVLSLRETDSIAHAHQVMLWSGSRHLPVVSSSGRIVGMVSDRDLLHFVSDPSLMPGQTPVTKVMTSDVITIDSHIPVSEASARMAAKKIDCLPVVEEGRLVGIVTAMDVLAERGRLIPTARARHMPIVADVMRRRAVAIGPEARLLDAVALLTESEIRHLPVVDTYKRVVGILSDRDIRAKVGDPLQALVDESPALALTVESVMTSNPITVRPSASVLEAADALLDDRIGAVPVVDEEDHLVGILSYVDLLAYLVGRGR